MLKFVIMLFTFSSIVAASPKNDSNTLDNLHAMVSSQVLEFSNDLDIYFSDNKHEDIPNQSRLKITFDTFLREARGPYTLPDINYQLVLPRTEKKLRFIIINENNDQDSETSKAQISSNNNTNIRREDGSNLLGAGLRYFTEKSGVKFYTDSGILVNIPPEIFFRFIAKKAIPLKKWVLKINEQIKWVNNDGFTSDLDIDFDRRLSSDFLLRMVNNVFWNDNDYIIRFENGPSLFQQINERSALSYHAHIITVNTPDYYVEDYLLQATHRYRLYKDWVFLTNSAFVNFPRLNNFHRTPGYYIGLDFIFGKI